MWTEKDGQLVGTFEFDDFNSAFGFMTRVALVAEQRNHHPDWTNCYNRVVIRLYTHDAGNVITNRDREMASIIESIFHR
jgi:4a-hydroxytetrahydrobiopterin dehydratase